MSDLVEVTYRQLTECSRLSRRMGPSTRLFAFLLAHVTKSTNAGQDEGFWTWIAMTNWRPPSPPALILARRAALLRNLLAPPIVSEQSLLSQSPPQSRHPGGPNADMKSFGCPILYRQFSSHNRLGVSSLLGADFMALPAITSSCSRQTPSGWLSSPRLI